MENGSLLAFQVPIVADEFPRQADRWKVPRVGALHSRREHPVGGACLVGQPGN